MTEKISQYELAAESFDFTQDKLREAASSDLLFSEVCAHEESNLDHGIRNPMFYPLNYERVLICLDTADRAAVKTTPDSTSVTVTTATNDRLFPRMIQYTQLPVKMPAGMRGSRRLFHAE